ncbi:MAG: release factor glutamine methyltransferase [Candidatus Latescibacterota bacterium]|jgi:release factor glutamine methyltransferase
MTIKTIKEKFTLDLQGLYPSEEIQSFFMMLSESFLNYSRIDIFLKQAEVLSEETTNKYFDALKRLQNQEPVQYIIGSTEFFGLRFNVNSATLIPRPETEELVRWVLENERGVEMDAILDIGTGSGCIAIALASELPNAAISGLDISEDAIRVAKENAKQNNVAVHFSYTDVLIANSLPGVFSCIVSNPPYVRDSEKDQMASNVLENEPASALYVSNEDPLLFYRKIAQLAKNHLVEGGQIFFEINEYLGKEMIALLRSEGYHEIQIRKDMFGKDRMLRCVFKRID